MKITVFGGGGFIGSTIVDRLLLDGHAIKVFERPSVVRYRNFSSDESVEWVAGDLLCKNDVGLAVCGADVILHLVSTTLPKNSNDDPIYDVQSNLVATLQMLNAMVLHKVPKIIFISSGGTVYGTPEYLPIDERHPTEPHVSYGITKLAIEKYLLMYERLHGIKSIIFRVANPYGERQRIETAQGAVGVFINQALRNLPIDIWGDGSVTRDYLHVDDVAEAFASAVSYSGLVSVFNVSSGVGTSLNDLIGLLEDVLGLKIVRNQLPGRSYDVPVSILSNKLLVTEMGWQPKVLLKDGLARTSSWMSDLLVK